MEIYIYEGNIQKGPFEFQQIQSLAASGQVSREALYWQSGMDGWESVSDLNVFVPPPPVPNEEQGSVLSGEEAKRVYRLAYYQRRVNQALGIFMLFGLSIWMVDALQLPQTNVIIGAITFCFAPYCFYGAYCFLRLNAEIYTWWLAPITCILSLFLPFLIMNVIIFSIMLRKIYKEHGIPTTTLGVSTQTLREIQDHF